MSQLLNQVQRYFADHPTDTYTCPRCGKGALVPQKDSFSVVEPKFSKDAFHHEDWDPHWVQERFTYQCVCDAKNCGEVAFVSGSGSVDQRYDHQGTPEYYSLYKICSFFPAPHIIRIPEGAPREVIERLELCFALFWTDTAAACNAMRASLEALLDELKVPNSAKSAKGKTYRLGLHQRLDSWAQQEKENAELCLALKEVGNLGSHGGTVREKHFFGVMEIYQYVLVQLFENNAERMKQLAAKIRADLKG